MTGQQLHVVGARPNFMKAGPVVRSLHALGSPPLLVHTGQHYDALMSEIFFEQLKLPKPDLNLGVGSGSHAEQTAKLMLALEEVMVTQQPSRAVVYGDINSTLAASIVAAKLHIPVAHVEAGLRSFDRTMPEEINRVVTDVLSDMHFVTSPEGVQQLIAEGLAEDGIHFVGNPMIDTLLGVRESLDPHLASTEFRIKGEYAVVTLHRPSNVDDPDVAAGIVAGLAKVSDLLPVLIPLHPRGRDVLSNAGLFDLPNVQVTDPLGYMPFMSLINSAALVLTDSGGIQEETTVLGVPCLTLRENTERPITITMGTNQLVGTDPQRIADAAASALQNPPQGKVPPLWDGKAGDRIARILSGEGSTQADDAE